MVPSLLLFLKDFYFPIALILSYDREYQQFISRSGCQFELQRSNVESRGTLYQELLAHVVYFAVHRPFQDLEMWECSWSLSPLPFFLHVHIVSTVPTA